jgi:uncharacterized protein YgbK (DUF1537 family)
VDALVVALKSRSIPAADAVAASREALDWLRAQGAERIYFKYASTFDSTPAGNIGPVTEALQEALGATATVACPAFPANGRTVRDGQLLLDGVPIDETHMRRHPLNPMTDADLRAVLGAQTEGSVGHLPLSHVRRGDGQVRATLGALRTAGRRHVIADAVEDDDVAILGRALVDEILVTGASALAAAIAVALRERRGTRPAEPAAEPDLAGPAAVLAGSCSAATLEQIGRMADRHPARTLDTAAIAAGRDVVEDAVAWAVPRIAEGPVLISSSAPADAVERVPDAHGRSIERALATIADRLVDNGVRRLVVAGGETSGAVIDALGVRLLDVGAEIEPGVPWVVAREPVPLTLVLKSGNFGSPDFFARALGETT